MHEDNILRPADCDFAIWGDACVLPSGLSNIPPIAMSAGLLITQKGLQPIEASGRNITKPSPSNDYTLFAETQATIYALDYPNMPTTIAVFTDRNEIIDCVNNRAIPDELLNRHPALQPVFEDLVDAAERHMYARAHFSRAIEVKKEERRERVQRSFAQVAHDGAHYMAALISGTSHKTDYYSDLGQMLASVGVIHCQAPKSLRKSVEHFVPRCA